MPELTLYKFDACPYCRRVSSYLEQRDIQIPIRDTMMEAGARGELMGIGGKSQVPCLVIDGDALYESLDIIQWFEENWDEVSA